MGFVHCALSNGAACSSPGGASLLLQVTYLDRFSSQSQPPSLSTAQVSPLRYTGRVVLVRDHFGFIQCQDLPTEADEVSRWGHKAPEGEAGTEPAPDGKHDAKHDAAKRKKKPGNRFQIFFSLAEVEGETEIKGGDEVEFVIGLNKGDRVARRVRFKSRPAPLPEPSATPLGERRKLFVNVRPMQCLML